jgi:hypothetical protein
VAITWTVEAAGGEALAVGEQAVELVAVRRELVAEVEHPLEHVLDLPDALADGDDGPGEAGAEHLRAGQVIGVRVGLEHGAQVSASRRRNSVTRSTDSVETTEPVGS